MGVSHETSLFDFKRTYVAFMCPRCCKMRTEVVEGHHAAILKNISEALLRGVRP